MNMTEKVAYIRGLMEGLELDASKKEVKVLNALVEILDDMAATVSELEEGYQDMADQLDEVDADLGDLEEEFYGGCDCDDDDCDCCCDDDDDLDLEDMDDCYYEVTCPSCRETICLSEDLLAEGQMECPNCGETLEFDLNGIADETEDANGCGCGCGCE